MRPKKLSAPLIRSCNVSTKKVSLPALALIAALGGGVSLAALPTANAAAPANSPASQTARHHRLPSEHVDARIAYLKTALKVTDAQEAQWDKVAGAMRENAKAMDKVIEQARTGHKDRETAVERLQARSQLETARAQNSERFLAAFQPFYNSLSDTQKKTADEVMAPHGHHHRR
jgi:hypothetical protein